MNTVSHRVNMDEYGNPTDGRGEWRQFLCRACGFIYDEKLGDPDGGLPAGTRYEDIADDWVCPLCGVTKKDFEPFVYQNNGSIQPIMHEVNTGVVVIGGGTAGWTAIEALRKLDKDLPITLISADSADRYMKPQLSVAISQNKKLCDLITKSAKTLSQTLNINLVPHTFVINIDSDTKKIHTTRGDFDYTALILAIGSVPNLPSTLPPDNVWRINHIDMFANLQQKLDQKPSQHIAIIGAGMIGVELAEDINKAGHKVSLIGADELPLANILPKIAGERLKNALIKQGIDYIGGTVVKGVQKLTDNYKITSTNQSITADHVIACTGLKLDDRLPKKAGIDYTPQGIVVNNRLQSSNPSIFAIGDCVVIDDKPCRFVAPLRQQASVIAQQILQLACQDYEHKPPVVRLKTKSILVNLSAMPTPHDDWQIELDDEKKLVMTQSLKDGLQVRLDMTYP